MDKFRRHPGLIMINKVDSCLNMLQRDESWDSIIKFVRFSFIATLFVAMND